MASEPDQACWDTQWVQPQNNGLDCSSLSRVVDLLHPFFSNLGEEVLRVLFLTSSWELCGMVAWSGNRTSIELPVRRIIASALAVDARALVIAHNHPSGDSRPSRRDVEATRDLSRICDRLGMPLIDHVILASNEITSLRSLRLI